MSFDPLPYRERLRSLAAWARPVPDRAEVSADVADALITEGSLPGPLRAYGVLAAHDASRIAGLLAARLAPPADPGCRDPPWTQSMTKVMKRTRQLVLIFFRDALGRFVRLPSVARTAARRVRSRLAVALPPAVQLALF